MENITGFAVTPYVKDASEKIIMVLLQPRMGKVHPISLELANTARFLASEGGFRTAGVFISGEFTTTMHAQLSACGLDEVFLYHDERFSPFIPELHAVALLNCIQATHPDTLLVGATPEGRSIAPLAAVALETGVTADCTELAIDANGLLVQTRPAFGGDLMARIVTPTARPQIATVRYGVLRNKMKESMGKTTRLTRSSVLLPAAHTYSKELIAPSTDEKEAPYVLAIGGGVRSREDVELFTRMSEAIGGKLMCSRALVERGWMHQSLQIGISGCCIAPRLLIVMGISGSVQFMAGIQGAQKICAVNADPHAPILRIADVPLVCDLYNVAALF
ncbi:MAG: electron transfer flavoprotein subunit alpha/FixB family protein [Treponema sp.]|nr:electron transfer flavoprotein subunit alpha/FixB family protein [Treponema sp.]